MKDLIEHSKQDYKYRDERSDHLSQDRIAEQVGQLDRLRMGISREDTSSLPINLFIIWKPLQRHDLVKYDHSLKSNSHRPFVLKVSRMMKLRHEETILKLLSGELWSLTSPNLILNYLLKPDVCVIASQLKSKGDKK